MLSAAEPVSHYLPSLLALAGIHLIAVASPGPAFVATVQLSAGQSRRTAILHAIGLGLAACTWAVAAILGLQAVMLQVVWLYRVIQFTGGVYLLYIGIQTWRHAHDRIVTRDVASAGISGVHAFSRGFGTNIANPKVMVFFASIFAALLDPAWPLWVRFAVLAIVAVDETAWYAMLAILLSTNRAQSAYRRAKVWIDRVAGAVMTIFGLKLIRGAAQLSVSEHGI